MTSYNKFAVIISSVCLLGLLSSVSHCQSEQERVSLQVQPPYFSPNDDGIQDEVFFTPILHADTDVSRWRLIIRNSKGRTVRKLSGGEFSALIRWDGKDKKGRPVKDGDYSAAIKVWGSGFSDMSPPVRLGVDDKPPLTAVSVSTTVLDLMSEGQRTIEFIPSIKDSSPIDRWQIQILDVTGRTVSVIWSTHPYTTVVWNGTDQTSGVMVPKGVYRCALQAWDAAGNMSEPSFIDVEVKVTAKEMLQQVLERVFPFESEIGLVIQLPRRDIFTIRKGRPDLRKGAEGYLREVALIVNSYPDAPVLIDGYSQTRRGTQFDRDRGSHYAWSVYSYLVREGNVQPSRLKVKGRGRTVPPERKKIDLKLVRNGVEILLEGKGPW